MQHWGTGDPGLGWTWKMLLQTQAPRVGEAGPLGTSAKAGLGRDGAGAQPGAMLAHRGLGAFGRR